MQQLVAATEERPIKAGSHKTVPGYTSREEIVRIQTFFLKIDIFESIIRGLSAIALKISRLDKCDGKPVEAGMVKTYNSAMDSGDPFAKSEAHAKPWVVLVTM